MKKNEEMHILLHELFPFIKKISREVKMALWYGINFLFMPWIILGYIKYLNFVVKFIF